MSPSSERRRLLIVGGEVCDTFTPETCTSGVCDDVDGSRTGRCAGERPVALFARAYNGSAACNVNGAEPPDEAYADDDPGTALRYCPELGTSCEATPFGADAVHTVIAFQEAVVVLRAPPGEMQQSIVSIERHAKRWFFATYPASVFTSCVR